MDQSNTSSVLQQWDGQPVHQAMRSILDRTLPPSHTLVFDHEGRVEGGEVQLLLGQAESHSLAIGDVVSVRKRLFSVLVEGLENMHRHAHDQDGNAAAALADDPEGYTIYMGNTVPVMLAAMMEHRIGLLNEMDDGSLKEHYLRLLSNEGRTERGGAGIGLFTMARKCSRPMRMHVMPLNEQLACMVLQIRVARRP
jgi:hypothetical protein